MLTKKRSELQCPDFGGDAGVQGLLGGLKASRLISRERGIFLGLKGRRKGYTYCLQELSKRYICKQWNLLPAIGNIREKEKHPTLMAS